MANEYEGTVQLHQEDGSFIGSGEAHLWVTDGPSWAGEIEPDAEARETIAATYITRTAIRLRTSSGREATAIMTEASPTWDRIDIEGSNEPPF